MTSQYFVIVFGRILLSLLFILSALSKIGGWTEFVQQMTAKGIPLAFVFLGVALVIELVGGLLLLFGFYPRIGAWLLILFLVPTTLIMHNFWAYAGAEQQLQLVNFLKNVAIIGGLLLVPARARERVVAMREHPEPMYDRPTHPRAA